MSLRDKLKERVNQDALALEIREWDEIIYVKPLTCGEMSKLQKRHPDFLSKMSVEGMVDLIIMKCLDKDGDPAFTLEDKPLLLREKVNVITAITSEIIGSSLSEDYEKN